MIVLDGVAPDPGLVLYGFAVSFAMLALGSFVFAKTQDGFILYI